MIFIYSKYYKSISFLVLFLYIGMFFFNILHYHPIKLYSEHSLRNSNYTDINSHFSFYNEYNCPANNIFNLVHNIVLDKKTNQNLSIPEIIFTNIQADFINYQQFYNTSQLRAPPLLS